MNKFISQDNPFARNPGLIGRVYNALSPDIYKTSQDLADELGKMARSSSVSAALSRMRAEGWIVYDESHAGKMKHYRRHDSTAVRLAIPQAAPQRRGNSPASKIVYKQPPERDVPALIQDALSILAKLESRACVADLSKVSTIELMDELNTRVKSNGGL